MYFDSLEDDGALAARVELGAGTKIDLVQQLRKHAQVTVNAASDLRATSCAVKLLLAADGLFACTILGQSFLHADFWTIFNN